MGKVVNDLPQKVTHDLHEIQRAGKQLLELAVSLGDTFVITNAASDWVQNSAAEWIPEVLDVLQNQKVRVISARTNHEPQYPGKPGQWKIEAFLEVQREFNPELITTLVSIGDSNFEMDAVHVMRTKFSQAFVKTIKFYENPCPEVLLGQLWAVMQKLERIVKEGRDMEMIIERHPIHP